MEQNVGMGDERGKKNTGLIVGMIVCAILAICGVAFGVYGMVTRTTSDEVAKHDFAVQVMGQDGTIETVDAEISENGVITLAEIGLARRQNPVIAKQAPEYYRLSFESQALPGEADNYRYTLNLGMENGEIYNCSVTKTDLNGKYVEQAVTGCQIAGLSGKIYKIVELGWGQALSEEDLIAFIMEDGSVQYLSLIDTLWNLDFNIDGTLKIDGIVTDALQVSVGSTAYVGGGVSAVFVLADGSLLEYAPAEMLE